MTPAKNACPICGYHTLEERFNYEICTICFWEDDTQVKLTEDLFSEANKLKVSEAQVNYMLHGVVDGNYKDNARKPITTDIRAKDWKLTQAANSQLTILKKRSTSRPKARSTSGPQAVAL